MAIFSRAPSLIPRGGSMLGVSFNMPGIPAGISTDYFFDRAAVRNALKPAVHKALVRGGLAVMQIARRSITRQGMAQPELKVMKTYAGLSLKQIAGLESASAERQGVMRDSRGRYLRGSGAIRSRDGQITEADRRKVLERIRQIRSKDASPAGTPPNTHRGNLRDRPGIVFAWDSTSESVVIGPMKVDDQMTRIAYLHEFGGSQRMRVWMWVPRYQGSYTPIIRQMPVGKRPARSDRWTVTDTVGTFVYPRRPYMRPAIDRAISSGRIAKEFANRFKVGGT